ncbi:MAG TPA: efflux RND transporter periplasmic adaptor subunit [Acidobacteriaceae bacterium]|jgi:multidrug efflux pump subunit AcrA (membrane-fusion protein)|nr:efflux RND transporter periplasmic adaptor subunit [Acidobacteriaceae bacterium]
MADETRDPRYPNERLPNEPQPGRRADASDEEHRLPWPDETDPSRLGERFEHGATPEERGLGRSFECTSEASQRELGREFADADFAERQRLARSFEDPNALDDARLGKSFEESNSSRKRRHMPLTEHAHKPANRRMLWVFLVAFALLFLVVVLVGWLPRHERDKDIDRRAQQQRDAKPVVEVATVQRAKNQAGLALPGTTIPLTEAYVYARANGYLAKRLVDIGDHVRKDQLLAVVESPDLDEQVAQARQQLAQAEQQLEQQRSQLALQTVTLQRYRVLVTKGVLSRQQGDQQETNYASEVANVSAAQRNVDAYRANLRRVQALQAFEYVRAPFAGIITQRNVEVGALISAAGASSGSGSAPAPQGQISSAGGSSQAAQSNNGGSSGGTGTAATPAQSPGQGGALFGLAQMQRLRTLVSVPEGYVSSIHVGGHAQLSFAEYPGTNFGGDITRTANSVDPNTRTMLTEVQVDNRAGKLFPGMYTVVTFAPAAAADGPVLVTGDAIVIRRDQSMIAKVMNGTVHLVPVTIGRDFGSAVELLTGVEPGDTVVTNVTDDVVEGAPVEVHRRPDPQSQPQQPPSQNTPPGGTTRYGNQGITDENLQGKTGQQNQQGRGNGSGQGKRSSSESKP